MPNTIKGRCRRFLSLVDVKSSRRVYKRLSNKSQEEEMKKLTEVGKTSALVNVKKETIDALSAYGAQAIPSITEVVKASNTEAVRVHGLETIKRIKEASGGPK